jgi:hypothetical protein
LDLWRGHREHLIMKGGAENMAEVVDMAGGEDKEGA